MVGVCECLNFAKKAGLDVGKVIDSLSAGAASSWSLVNLGPRMARRDFAPGFKVKLLQKDLRYVLETANDLDAPSPGDGASPRALHPARGGGPRRRRDAGPVDRDRAIDEPRVKGRNPYISRGAAFQDDMCDCEELEFEDFEVMLSAISKMSAAQSAEAPPPVPQLVVAKQRK